MSNSTLKTANTWQVTPAEARRMQEDLRERIRLQPLAVKPRYIGGADISFNKYSPTVFAGIVVLDADTMDIVDSGSAVMDVSFPYIPGLLSFREIPPLLQAWQALETKPDVLVLDGQGIAHPRRMGIAAHFGLIMSIPTIGCAKNLLFGTYEPLDIEAGSISPLFADEEPIGAVIRTKRNVKPIFVSPGYLTDIESSIALMLQCARGYRIPEPTRQAHLYVNDLRRSAMQSA